MHAICGQDEPYSLMCPLPDYSPWDGFLPDVVHCPTGCVATAATQLCFHVGVASEMG
ncbi:MAG: C10 family peptidase [Prevotella sp.]|nr:C10 family peptidase [Prevotella sp.]